MGLSYPTHILSSLITNPLSTKSSISTPTLEANQTTYLEGNLFVDPLIDSI